MRRELAAAPRASLSTSTRPRSLLPTKRATHFRVTQEGNCTHRARCVSISISLSLGLRVSPVTLALTSDAVCSLYRRVCSVNCLLVQIVFCLLSIFARSSENARENSRLLVRRLLRT